MTVPSLRVADLEIKGLSDGILKTTLDIVLGMDRAQAEQLVGGTQDGSLFISVNNFLLQRGDETILLDAGAGNTMQPTLGKLPGNLRAIGVDPQSVTHVVLTHLHPDHANGLVDDGGQPHYPNAAIIVHEKEAEFWLGPGAGNEPDNVRRNRARTKINLAPYAERLRRARGNEEILGFTPILAPGHTPGHTCWRIGSGRDALLAWGDIVHLSAIQISHPETAMTYDLDKALAAKSRKRILDMAATDHVAIAGAHVSAPGFGHIVRRAGTYAFEPAF
jgi:glyoxylase-like metal-dependent hydrolase (beta-lactamase superfamily II)